METSIWSPSLVYRIASLRELEESGNLLTSLYSSVILISSGSTIAYSFLGTKSSPSCLQGNMESLVGKGHWLEPSKSIVRISYSLYPLTAAKEAGGIEMK